jgi:MinD-like ATPase involved in chromosome partitioning or flagellar assembly
MPGDELLTRLVSRGVYDILYGESVKIQDVCDMVFKPRDYSYACTLQGIEAADDKSIGLSKPKIVEQIDESPKPSWEKQTNYGQQNMNQTFNPNQNMAPNYNQDTSRNLNQNTTPDYTHAEKSGNQDTSVLTQNMSNFQNADIYGNTEDETSILVSDVYSPKGIIFNPVGGSNQIITTAPKTVAAYSGNAVYREDNILKGQGAAVKRGKFLTFAGARQGVGCTSSAINTAYAFAMEGKNVLLLDATFGRSCIYQKLGLPENYGNTVEDVLRAHAGGQNISLMPLSKPQIKGVDGNKPSIPDSLKFLRFSESFDGKEELSYFGETLDSLSQYFDYIISDISLKSSPVTNELMKRASKVVVVVLQDIYEVNTANVAVSSLDGDFRIFGKILPLINRTVKRGVPEAELVKGVFSATECITIPEDTFGFMRAYSVGKPYYLFAKRKTQDRFLDIMKLI